ncbi:MAG: hypothetical protein HFJ02_07160 [Bacilli bacterium]|nr:hypothetical protein [Bacilli bacterium]
MSEDKEYPIKFAVWELKRSGGCLVGYRDIIIGYIPSKCYAVESDIKYCPNKAIKIFHKVVFPFENEEFERFQYSLQNGYPYDIGERIFPSYDANGNPYPYEIVLDIYDTYEEAKEAADRQNKAILVSEEFQEKSEESKKFFLKQLTLCQSFEQLVTSATLDMTVTSENNITEVFQLLKKK